MSELRKVWSTYRRTWRQTHSLSIETVHILGRKKIWAKIRKKRWINWKTAVSMVCLHKIHSIRQTRFHISFKTITQSQWNIVHTQVNNSKRTKENIKHCNLIKMMKRNRKQMHNSNKWVMQTNWYSMRQGCTIIPALLDYKHGQVNLGSHNRTRRS